MATETNPPITNLPINTSAPKLQKLPLYPSDSVPTIQRLPYKPTGEEKLTLYSNRNNSNMSNATVDAQTALLHKGGDYGDVTYGKTNYTRNKATSSDGVKYLDSNGKRTKEGADKMITDNADYIIAAAKDFGINPGILAAVIYTEQIENGDWKDDYIDGIAGVFGIDTSIGLGQIKLSKAKQMEDEGYMPPVVSDKKSIYVPGIGYSRGIERIIREQALEDPETNIRYTAAYLKYQQDRWKEAYPIIDGKTDILATLYNQKEQRPPHGDPKPNKFGRAAKENYYYVRELLGLE